MRVLILKKTYLALSIFVIGALHLFIARQATKPSMELRLALVRNEYLDTPPWKIMVLGEHDSGNEYVAEVLRDAFGNDMVNLHEHIVRHDLLDQNELKDIAGRTGILWVMVVRSPCDWADALILHQKELCQDHMIDDPAQCEAHDFASETDYYRIPWYDIKGDYSDTDDAESVIASKTEQNSEYDDIFDLRQQKLLIMKQITDVVPRHVKILRLREFELNPDVFVKDLVTEYLFKLQKTYEPNTSTNTTDPTSFSCIYDTKWREAMQRTDWTLEGFFGYNQQDCHLCRGSGLQLTTDAPSNIYILGERNSGTTFVSNTLAEAFDPPNEMGSHLEKFSSDIPVLLHKHMFRHDLLSRKELAEIKERDDILWVMVIRSPCDW